MSSGFPKDPLGGCWVVLRGGVLIVLWWRVERVALEVERIALEVERVALEVELA